MLKNVLKVLKKEDAFFLMQPGLGRSTAHELMMGAIVTVGSGRNPHSVPDERTEALLQGCTSLLYIFYTLCCPRMDTYASLELVTCYEKGEREVYWKFYLWSVSDLFWVTLAQWPELSKSVVLTCLFYNTPPQT